MAQITLARELHEAIDKHIKEIRGERTYDAVFCGCVVRGVETIVSLDGEYQKLAKLVDKSNKTGPFTYRETVDFGALYDTHRVELGHHGITGRRPMIVEGILTYLKSAHLVRITNGKLVPSA